MIEYKYRKSQEAIEAGARRLASSSAYGGPKLGNVFATFEFDRRKTVPFMAMLVALMLLGLGRVYYDGTFEGNWLSTFVLVIVPALAFVMIGMDLVREGPVVFIAEKGMLDRRRGEEPVPWEMIEEAELRRRPFISAVRVVLRGRDRYDIELALLKADPGEVMVLINEAARRAEEARSS
jgi:hypothetical protein